MSVDFLSKNFPPFQVHHAKKPPRFYPDGFQRNVIDFYFIFSDCRLRKALYLQFSYFIWPLVSLLPYLYLRLACLSNIIRLLFPFKPIRQIKSSIRRCWILFVILIYSNSIFLPAVRQTHLYPEYLQRFWHNAHRTQSNPAQ